MYFDRSRKPAGKKLRVVFFLTVSLLFHAVLLACLVDPGKRERPTRVEVGLVFLPPMVAGGKNDPDPRPQPSPAPATQRKALPRNPSPPPRSTDKFPVTGGSRRTDPPPHPPRPEHEPENPPPTPPAEDPSPTFAEDPPHLELSAPVGKDPEDLPVDEDAGPRPQPEPAPLSEGGTANASAPLVDASPMYDRNDPPAYPRLARERGWEGEVLLRVVVSETGKVRRASVERPSPHPVLDAAALRAVRRWRFHPSLLGSNPVEGEVLVPMNFRLLGG